MRVKKLDVSLNKNELKEDIFPLNAEVISSSYDFSYPL